MFEHVFGIVGGQIFSDLSSFPIQKSLTFCISCSIMTSAFMALIPYLWVVICYVSNCYNPQNGIFLQDQF